MFQWFKHIGKERKDTENQPGHLIARPHRYMHKRRQKGATFGNIVTIW